jgi:hypothetical protein
MSKRAKVQETHKHDYGIHGRCACGDLCGCSFNPTSLNDYCEKHRPTNCECDLSVGFLCPKHEMERRAYKRKENRRG